MHARLLFAKPLSHDQDVKQNQFLSAANLVWIYRFPFTTLVALLELKNPFYLQRGQLTYSKALTKIEKQTASSRIWTQLADSIFCDYNFYTKPASISY